MPRDHADPVGQVAAALDLTAAGAVDEDTLPDLDMVARLQHGFLDRLVIDEGAVSAADIDDTVAALDLAKLRMAARNLGVVHADLADRVSAHAQDRAGQVKLLA